MNDRLRICFVNSLFSPAVGGAETQSERQARKLQALGNDVMVVTLRADKKWKRREMLDGLPVVRIGGLYRRNGQLRMGRVGYLPCTIAMLLALWRSRSQYDVIHVFQITPLAAVAALIGRLTHKPVVISLQSTGPDEVQLNLLKEGARLMAGTLTDSEMLTVDIKNVVTGDLTYFSRWVFGGKIYMNFLRNSNATYHVNSSRSLSYLLAHGFCYEQIVRIPHGVDIDEFQSIAEHRPDPAKPERAIFCVARLDYVKGIDVLLHAWSRMMHEPAEWRTHLKPRLYLAGDGRQRKQFEYIAAELGIQDSVEFLGMRKDIPDLLTQAWGYVQPSRWESLSNALLEAMASGLPCISTRVSGSEDIISNGVNGLLVEPNQPTELAEALRRIIKDSELAQQMGSKAYTTILGEYQLTSVVKRFDELYRRLVEESEEEGIEIERAQEITSQHQEALEVRGQGKK